MIPVQRKYEPNGGVVHLVDNTIHLRGGLELQRAFCGITREVEDWKGADGPHEQLRAARMPTCAYCEANAP